MYDFDGLDVVEAEVYVEFVAQGVDKATALRRVLEDEMLGAADGGNRRRPQRRGDAPGRTLRRRDGERYGGGQNGRRRRLGLDAAGPRRRQRGARRAAGAAAALAAPALARRLRGRTEKIRRGASRSNDKLAPRAPVADRVARVPGGPAAVLVPGRRLGAPGLRGPRHGGGSAAIVRSGSAPRGCVAADVGLPAVFAAATWVAMIALQVGVGHGLLDKRAPSADEPVAPRASS